MGMTSALLAEIQNALREEGIDGWLLYNFRGSNVFATRILDLPPHIMQTRRYFYFVPAQGTPRKLVHGIEEWNLDSLPGGKATYVSWRSLEEGLEALVKGSKRVAMEYSPRNAIPYVSTVDGGTIEQVRAAGVEVVSSANLVQRFEACWTEEQAKDNFETAKQLRAVADEAFRFIGSKLTGGQRLTEYEVQQFMVAEFEKRGIWSEEAPNCSVNANAANPHYEPTKDINTEVKKGDNVLLDLWAKKKKPHSVYADITWMGYAGSSVPPEYEAVFQVVRSARDAGVGAVKKAFAEGKEIRGCDVDDATREPIEKNGYGKYFIHRTGHSIGEVIHGNGANMDNLETRDERRIIPMTSFSIEPGVYFPGKYGVRSEIDVFITARKEVIVTGLPTQETVVPILK